MMWSIQFPRPAGITGRYNSLYYAQCPEIRDGTDPDMRLSRWLAHPYTHAAALLLSLLAALAIVAFMVGTLEYTKTRGRLLLTAFLVAGYFMTTLAATAAPKEGAMRWLFTALLAWATLALFLLLLGLWATPGSNEFWKAAAGTTFLAFGMSFAGLALGLGSGGRPARLLAWVSAILAALMTMMTVLAIAFEIRAAAYWWTFGLLVVCWLGGSATLVAMRLWRKRSADR